MSSFFFGDYQPRLEGSKTVAGKRFDNHRRTRRHRQNRWTLSRSHCRLDTPLARHKRHNTKTHWHAKKTLSNFFHGFFPPSSAVCNYEGEKKKTEIQNLCPSPCLTLMVAERVSRNRQCFLTRITLESLQDLQDLLRQDEIQRRFT